MSQTWALARSRVSWIVARWRFSRLIALAVSLPLIVPATGCTAIGALVGRSVDQAKPGFRIISAEKAAHEVAGTRMTLYTRDSRERVGVFAGLRVGGSSGLPSPVPESRRPSGGVSRLPCPGDTVLITLAKRQYSRRFEGLARPGDLVIAAGSRIRVREDDPVAIFLPPAGLTAEFRSLADIDRWQWKDGVVSGGREVAGPLTTKWAVEHGSIDGNVVQILMVERPGQLTAIRIAEVDSVRVPRTKRGILWGAIIGAPLDGLFIYALSKFNPVGRPQ